MWGFFLFKVIQGSVASGENHKGERTAQLKAGGCCGLLQRGSASKEYPECICAWAPRPIHSTIFFSDWASSSALFLLPWVSCAHSCLQTQFPLLTPLSCLPQGGCSTVRSCDSQTHSLWLPFDPQCLPRPLQVPRASLASSLFSRHSEHPILPASPEN